MVDAKMQEEEEEEGAPNTNAPRPRVGIIGTGMLGSAVAARLAESGAYEVSAYNRTAQNARAAGAAGARILESPAAVAGESDIVITTVRDADAVRGVSFGSGGIVEGRHGNLTVADMSTIDPAGSKEITAEYAQYGISRVDSPVMGGPDAAAAGRLVVMASGSRVAFDACSPVFDHMAESVFYLGDRPGTAHTIKLAMNMQITMLALSLAEGITLVDRSGADPKAFLDVLNSTYFSTGMSRKKAYNMISGRQSPTFTLANLRKDIGIMASAADRRGVYLPMTKAAEKVYDEALKEGHGELDYTCIIRHIRERQDREERQQSQ